MGLDNNAITITDACICWYQGCLMTPGCFGCMSSFTYCCCEGEFCCKNTSMLMCGCCALRCISPSTCCKVQTQACCCVEAGAFPPDAEVPAMFGSMGLVCYPKFACCKTLGEIMAPAEG